MAGLQRSEVSFRRQGSSGLVWDDKLVSGELVKLSHKQEAGQDHKEAEEPSRTNNIAPINTNLERSQSNGGGRGRYRTEKVSPEIEPPSPKVSVCGFCSAFAKPDKKRRRAKPGKRRSR